MEYYFIMGIYSCYVKCDSSIEALLDLKFFDMASELLASLSPPWIILHKLKENLIAGIYFQPSSFLTFNLSTQKHMKE